MGELTEVLVYASLHLALVCMCIGIAVLCMDDNTAEAPAEREMLLLENSPRPIQDDQEQHLADDSL